MSEKKNKRDIKQTLSLVTRGIKHLLLHNGWLKLIAILISVFLWAGLISQDESITRDKAFQDVKVTITGQETMKNSGFIVTTDLSDLNRTLGHSIDLQARYKFSKDISIIAGYTQMHGTETMDRLKQGNGNKRARWAWFSFVVSPSLFTTKW